MKKVNDFFEKYEIPLWQLIAAIWFLVEYFCNKSVESLLWDGVFWAAFAIMDFIRIKLQKKQK